MAASVRDVQNLVTTVVGLQGNPVSPTVPAVGDTLVWDGTAWSPAVPSGGGSGRFVPQLDPSNDVAVSCPGGPSTAPFISAFEAPVSADGDSLGIRLQRDVDGTAIFLRGPTFPDPSIANGMQFWLGDGGNLLFAFTPTGQITLPAMPVGSMDATPRQYVDDGFFPLVGVTDGSNAAAGQVGEYVSAVETTFSYTANNEFATANQISLTPGDWDLSANVLFDGTNATPSEIQLIIAQILLTTNESEAVYNESNFLRGAMISPTQIVAVASVLTPMVRMNITTTTTIYLRVLAYWNTTSNNLTVASAILARRMR